MAHHDCWHCGKPISDYPNCCKITQKKYIESQRREWARSKAREVLNKKHEREISQVVCVLLENEAYHYDKHYREWWLKEIKQIKGE